MVDMVPGPLGEEEVAARGARDEGGGQGGDTTGGSLQPGGIAEAALNGEGEGGRGGGRQVYQTVLAPHGYIYAICGMLYKYMYISYN